MSSFSDVSVHYSLQATEERFASSSTSDSADIPDSKYSHAGALLLVCFFLGSHKAEKHWSPRIWLHFVCFWLWPMLEVCPSQWSSCLHLCCSGGCTPPCFSLGAWDSLFSLLFVCLSFDIFLSHTGMMFSLCKGLGPGTRIPKFPFAGVPPSPWMGWGRSAGCVGGRAAFCTAPLPWVRPWGRARGPTGVGFASDCAVLTRWVSDSSISHVPVQQLFKEQDC